MTKYLLTLITICLLSTSAHAGADYSLCFSPEGNCEGRVVKEIDAAQHSVYVMMYVFNSKPIAKALVRAKQRGLKVAVIIDHHESLSRFSADELMVGKQVAVYLDRAHPKLHNKVVIIDSSTVITGSFNFTATANKENGENLLILRGEKKMAHQYITDFNRHFQHSEVGYLIKVLRTTWYSLEDDVP